MTQPLSIRSASGGPAPSVLTGLNTYRSIEEFRALAPLPDDAQRLFDRAVINVGMDRLALVQDVINAGLTFPLPNWLGVPSVYWERKSRTGHAQRTMRPGSLEERQHFDRSGVTYPIYATMDGFSFHDRELLTAERAGAPLDTEHTEEATRNVNEAIEDAAINGGMTVAGNSSPGFLNAPNVNTFTYVDSEAWDAVGHSGADIVDDVIGMADVLKGDRYFGPYRLVIPTDYENKLNKQYSANYSRNIRSVLEDLRFGGQNLTITVADQLPDDRTILYQATRNVVDVIVGQQPTLVSWGGRSPWDREFAVVACIIVRVKDDYDGNSGICTGNTS